MNEIVAGKYRVDRVLGQGGMGVVLAVWHLQLEERAAIKIMLPEAAASGDAVARFLREARAAAKIQSEHVARVRDVGTLDNGQPYMVMEYLEGEDLSAVVANRGALPVEDAVSYLLQACEALAEAHSIGIVHRDLKPGNLFLSRRRDGSELVKVLDFGISKVTGAAASGSDSAKTRTSALMGSPLYMSPEQMTSSRDVDARSDIWALGVILHELVTGRTPFDGETLPQICAMILSGPTPSVRAARADLPHALDAVITRCLEKNPDARFRNVAELALALQPFAARRSLVSVERISRLAGVGSGTVALEPSAPVSGASEAQTQRSAGTNFDFGKTAPNGGSKSRAVWIALGGMLVGGVAAGAFALRPSETSTPLAESVAPNPVPSAAPVQAPVPSVAPQLTPPVPSTSVTAPPPVPASASAAPLAAAPAVAPRTPGARVPKQAPAAMSTSKQTAT
ncbi:MAG TPA: protein kinase, partial [Polyangiaceae bacterium]|nr:protein kinase [Polyangiaceae bacterium]